MKTKGPRGSHALASKKTAMLSEMDGILGLKLLHGCCTQGCCNDPSPQPSIVRRSHSVHMGA